MVGNLCYTFWVGYAFSDGSEGAAWYKKLKGVEHFFICTLLLIWTEHATFR